MTTMTDQAHEGGSAMANDGGFWSMTKQTDQVHNEGWMMTNDGDFWWMTTQNDPVQLGGAGRWQLATAISGSTLTKFADLAHASTTCSVWSTTGSCTTTSNLGLAKI